MPLPAHECTHAQMDRQLKNMMPPVDHNGPQDGWLSIIKMFFYEFHFTKHHLNPHKRKTDHGRWCLAVSVIPQLAAEAAMMDLCGQMTMPNAWHWSPRLSELTHSALVTQQWHHVALTVTDQQLRWLQIGLHSQLMLSSRMHQMPSESHSCRNSPWQAKQAKFTSYKLRFMSHSTQNRSLWKNGITETKPNTKTKQHKPEENGKPVGKYPYHTEHAHMGSGGTKPSRHVSFSIMAIIHYTHQPALAGTSSLELVQVLLPACPCS